MYNTLEGGIYGIDDAYYCIWRMAGLFWLIAVTLLDVRDIYASGGRRLTEEQYQVVYSVQYWDGITAWKRFM